MRDFLNYETSGIPEWTLTLHRADETAKRPKYVKGKGLWKNGSFTHWVMRALKSQVEPATILDHPVREPPTNTCTRTCFRSVAVLGHSTVQGAMALGFSNDLRSVTLLRPRTGALRPNLVSRQSAFSDRLLDYARDRAKKLPVGSRQIESDHSHHPTTPQISRCLVERNTVPSHAQPSHRKNQKPPEHLLAK